MTNTCPVPGASSQPSQPCSTSGSAQIGASATHAPLPSQVPPACRHDGLRLSQEAQL
jgi:hypothetical protein